MSKICEFCNKETAYIPIAEMEEHDATVYFCYDCHAEYTFFPRGQRANASLYVKVGERTFRWSVNSSGTAQLWFVGTPGIPGVSKNLDMKCLKVFKETDIPELNPANATERIGDWLPFL